MLSVSEAQLRPLPRWGELARAIAWGCWTAAISFRVVCDLTAIDDDGAWRVLHVAVGAIAVASAVVWAVAAYRRHH